MSDGNTNTLIDASRHFDRFTHDVEMARSKSQVKDQIPSFKMDDGAKPGEFAQLVRAFVKQLPRTVSNIEVRASGSVAANWIEADEVLSKKDFLMRVKICRKEAKESRLFLRLVVGPTRS